MVNHVFSFPIREKQLLLLINAHAGKEEIRNQLLDVIDQFIKAGWTVTVHTTQKRLEIPALLAQYGDKFPLVVCCGGDGTLNETITGIMQCSHRPLLGYLPTGTVNDFASSLGLKKQIPQAVQTVIHGVPFPCDIGKFGSRYFSYIAAFGAFTNVAYETPQQSKNLLGRAAYFLEAIRRLPSIKSYSMQISYDDGEIEGDFLFGMVTNSRSVGGFPFYEGQNISMNDGLLEVLLISNPQTPGQAQQIISELLSRQTNSRFLISFRTSSLSFHSSESVPWTLDGEFGGNCQEAEIQNLPRAISIVVDPPSSKQ